MNVLTSQQEYHKLQAEIKQLLAQKETLLTQWNQKYEDNDGPKRYQDELYLDYKNNLQPRLDWLEQARTEMLYEKYFQDHSRGLINATSPEGKFWDEKYYGEIMDSLGKWYKKCLHNVNDFRLLYEGVTEDYLDPQSEEKGISTSAREFIGNLVYKLIREISEPTLYLYDNDHYEGFLFRNLYQWRKQNSKNV